MTLSDALENLRAEVSQREVAALSSEYYLEAHNRFESVSAQQGLLRAFLLEEIAALVTRKGRAVSLLSAGCGGGQLDAALIDALGEKLASYTGIDVNAAELARLEEMLAGRRNAVVELADILTYAPGAPFDAVISIHVAYYVENKAHYLARLRDFTAEGGVAVIALAPFSPMNEIASVFWSRQGVEDFFADDFAGLLAQAGVAARRSRIEASIPLSYYLGEDADQAVIDFTVQAALGDAEPPLRAALEDTFRAAAIAADGEPALSHPVDVFVLEAG